MMQLRVLTLHTQLIELISFSAGKGGRTFINERPERHSAIVKTPGLRSKDRTSFERRKERKDSVLRARDAQNNLRSVVLDEKR
jgi:hypothetical protein